MPRCSEQGGPRPPFHASAHRPRGHVRVTVLRSRRVCGKREPPGQARTLARRVGVWSQAEGPTGGDQAVLWPSRQCLVTCWALGLLSLEGVGFWGLWQIAISEAPWPSQKFMGWQNFLEHTPWPGRAAQCPVHPEWGWAVAGGVSTLLPKEKPRVKGHSLSLAAWGRREWWVEPQDHHLLPDPGRAPQLFWASGSSSVKWGDPCPSCPFSGSCEEPGGKGDAGERALGPEVGLELGPLCIMPESQLPGGWPGRWVGGGQWPARADLGHRGPQDRPHHPTS